MKKKKNFTFVVVRNCNGNSYRGTINFEKYTYYVDYYNHRKIRLSFPSLDAILQHFLELDCSIIFF